MGWDGMGWIAYYSAVSVAVHWPGATSKVSRSTPISHRIHCGSMRLGPVKRCPPETTEIEKRQLSIPTYYISVRSRRVKSLDQWPTQRGGQYCVQSRVAM